MRRKFLVYAILIALALLLLWFFTSFIGQGKIVINAPEKTPGGSNVEVIITRDGQPEDEFILAPGESRTVRLEKGTVRVDSSVGNLKAVDVVEIGKTKELLAPSGQQHEATQLGSNAVFCPVVLQNAVFSYNCFGDGIIVRHTSKTQSSTMYGAQTFAALKPLKTGLIGFYPTNLTELQYLELANETVQRVSLPASVQSVLNKEFPLIVTSSEPGSGRFALVFTSANKIFLFDDLGDTSPVEVKPPTALNEKGRSTTPSFSGDEFILFAGIVQSAHEGEGTEEGAEQRTNLAAFIYEYSADGNLTKTVNLPEGFTATAAYKLADNYYVAEHTANIQFYFQDGDELKSIYSLDEISSWTHMNDKAYLQAAGVLYEFVPGEDGLFGLHSIFSAPTVRVSQPSTSVRGLVFTGYAGETSEELLQIFLLEDTVVDPDTPLTPSTRSSTAFIGFEKFTDFGVSSDQLNGMREAIKAYIDQTGTPVAQAIASGIIIKNAPSGSVNSFDTATFNLTLDGKTLQARMEYFDLTDMRLYLYDSGGTQVFDSTAAQ